MIGQDGCRHAGFSGRPFVAEAIFCYSYFCQRQVNRLACRLILFLRWARLRKSHSAEQRMALGLYGTNSCRQGATATLFAITASDLLFWYSTSVLPMLGS